MNSKISRFAECLIFEAGEKAIGHVPTFFELSGADCVKKSASEILDNDYAHYPFDLRHLGGCV